MPLPRDYPFGIRCSDYPPVFLKHTHVRDSLSSQEGVTDRLLISLPFSYETSPNKRYPVVYLLDGYWDFPLVWGVYSHLYFDNAVPEYILVGLSYAGDSLDLDAFRKMDLGPPSQPNDKGRDYLKRIQTSIIPFVESEYAVDPSFRCIAGTSLGATFALAGMFREPDLFQGVIALSPTTRSYDNWLFGLEEHYFATKQGSIGKLFGARPSLPIRIFLGSGAADNPKIVQDIDSFCSQLKSRSYKFLELQYRPMEGEKHAGIKPEGTNRGLRHVFLPHVTLN